MNAEGLRLRGEPFALGWRRPASSRPCGSAFRTERTSHPNRLAGWMARKERKRWSAGRGSAKNAKIGQTKPANSHSIKYLTLRTKPKQSQNKAKTKPISPLDSTWLFETKPKQSQQVL